MERYICIHCHFYQPPRENPWLEAIELQDSAFPFHDWNTRITDECYGPNSMSRILDADKQIIEIINNYSRISFNFGPTLLAWLEDNSPDVYQAILQADKESQKLFSGHGSAIAQVYNHVILPLANRRDRYTQIYWGIKDFEHRFGRLPEGMWLPEAAVDLETLDILADSGFKFTVLSPYQAERCRQIGTYHWEDINGGRIDPTRAYEINLPSKRKISIFFYDGPISRAVAFEGLLENGVSFANRLMTGFSEHRKWPQLVHIATDGESYGHHHKFGEMALSYALRYLENNKSVKLTNYGEYLSNYPANYEAQIIEKSSWSCPHGVDRWWKDCGCNTGGHSEWNQKWRTPLRQTLDWLRDTVANPYQEKAGELFTDPWSVRNDYISVILDRSPKNLRDFFNLHCGSKIKEIDRIKALKLLELQRHAMLMFTSCGWFFDELSGLETVQVIQYAGRVVQLAQELFEDSIEEEFLKRLEMAKSNLPEHTNGRVIYKKFVKSCIIDLVKVGAHYAVSSLFEEYSDPQQIYCYDIDLQDYHKADCGKARLGIGKIEVATQITREKQNISFAVLHFGDHNLNAGVREFRGDLAYQEMVSEITAAFSKGDFPKVLRLMDKHFGISNYSLKSLFRDEQNKVVNKILESTQKEMEAEFRKIYQNNYPLMRYLSDVDNLVPRAFQSSARVILNSDLLNALRSDNPDQVAINKLLADVKLWKVGLGTDLGYVFRTTLEKKMKAYREKPEDVKLLNQMVELIGLTNSLPFAVDLKTVQNIYFRLLKNTYPEIRAKHKQTDSTIVNFNKLFTQLGEKLSIRVEPDSR